VCWKRSVETLTARKQLLPELGARGMEDLPVPGGHPAEISKEGLKTLGFSAGGHQLYAARARFA
jgi:hypothetical protein